MEDNSVKGGSLPHNSLVNQL